MGSLPVLKGWPLHQIKPNLSVSEIRPVGDRLELQVPEIRDGFLNKLISSYNWKQFSLARVEGWGQGGCEMRQERRRAARPCYQAQRPRGGI